MVDVSRECCERYFGMDDELFDYTMATLRWLLALCGERYFGMDDELFDYTMATLRWLLALCERVA